MRVYFQSDFWMAPSRRSHVNRVPLGDLTNSTNDSITTPPPSIRRSAASMEKRRQSDRDRYAAMSAAMSDEMRSEQNRKRRENISDDKRSEINKKRRKKYKVKNQGQVQSGSNLSSQSTVANTLVEEDHDNEWLHRQSDHSVEGLQELSVCIDNHGLIIGVDGARDVGPSLHEDESINVQVTDIRTPDTNVYGPNDAKQSLQEHESNTEQETGT
ncbi:unnamed protein product [Urochloa humidicola]